MCQVYGNTYLVEFLTDNSSMLCVPSNYKHTIAVQQLDTDLGYGMRQSSLILFISLWTIITCVETISLHLLHCLRLMTVKSCGPL